MTEAMTLAPGEKLANRAMDFIDGLQLSVATYAPKIGDVALKAMQVEAIIHLVTGAVALMVAGRQWKTMCRHWRMLSLPYGEQPEGYGGDSYHGWGATVSTVVVVVAGIIGLACLMSSHNWITAFSPEMGVAIRAIDMAEIAARSE